MKKREVAIEAINRWDDDSMSVLYDEYYAALVSYGLQILHLKEEAEDVVQSVYAKLWESQPSFESTGELRRYLFERAQWLYQCHPSAEGKVWLFCCDVRPERS